MSEQLEEEILIMQPDLYRWIGTETNATMLSAVLGVVFVTTHRLCFLTGIGLSKDDFDSEDSITTLIDRYLEDSSCFGLPYDQIASIEVLKRWDGGNYLRVMGINENDEGFAYAFMSRYGLNPTELNEIKSEVDERITPRDIDPDLIDDLEPDSPLGIHRIGIPLFGLAVFIYAMLPYSHEIKEIWAKKVVKNEVFTKASYFNADVQLLDAIDQGDQETINETFKSLQYIRDDNCYVNCSSIYARPRIEKVER